MGVVGEEDGWEDGCMLGLELCCAEGHSEGREVGWPEGLEEGWEVGLDGLEVG